ncbi:MAG: hypothetical protein WEB58_20055 [Planctomycetaceae bacterium]
MSTSANTSDAPLPDHSAPAPASASNPNPSFLRYIYNHNPFYVISAFLMIYAVRSGYGTLEIGSINTWLMMGVLAAYTLVLAGIVVLIVRKGKVWEDARSIFVILLLLFLAVSVSADDLFNTTSSYSAGTALLAGGFLFSAIVSELVFLGTRIRLAWGYRLPYHLMLALFYVAPWWYAPEIHPRDSAILEWSLLAFPVISAVLFLCLIPAVRGGAAYNSANGTPWPWPWFPGIGFGVIAAVVAFRSYALCMTFGPTGPIWRYELSGKSINFDTIWAPYFLVPLGLACLMLLKEVGVATGSKRLLRGIMIAAPALLLLSLLQSHGMVQRRFLFAVTETIGSPLWLTACALIGFYALAWTRRLPFAGLGLTALVLLLSIVGPETIDSRSLTAPQPWPFGVVGLVLVMRGLMQRSSLWCSMGALAGAIGLWYFLPMTPLFAYRNLLSYHSLWLAWLAIGLAFRDEFARVLRAVAAILIPFAAMAAFNAATAADIPMSWRISYVGGMATLSLIIARFWRDWWYLAAFSVISLFGAYGGAAWMFHAASASLSRPAVMAFSWSIAALIIGFLISAHKANWLRPRSGRPLTDEIDMQPPLG